MSCSPHDPIFRTCARLSLLGVALAWALAANSAVAQNLQDSQLDQLPGVWAGGAAWGDYDDDGDLDLALIGETIEDAAGSRIAQIFRNDDDLLVEDFAQTDRLRGVYFGEAAWADYDDDGDLDLAIAGWDSDGSESLRLYLNEPGSQAPDRLLTLDLTQVDEFGTSNFAGVRYASVAWADIDNDGDLDLVVSGMTKNGISLTRVYGNADGVLQVDAVNSEAVINVHHGDLAWADYDNDGDLDLAVSGENVTTEGGIGSVTEFYRNDPLGSLGLDPGLDLGVDPTTGYRNKIKGGSLAWADYDQDGNIDLAVSGRDEGLSAVLSLFRNRPAGNLSHDERFSLSRSLRVDGELDWADYDNDGDPDLVVAGRTILSTYRALVLENRDGAVTGVSVEPNLGGLAGGAAVWADYNGDGRVDLLLSGVNESGERQTVLYDNLGTPTANRAPDPPATLNPVKVSSRRVVFSWPPGQDVESASLTYNLRIGSDPGAGDILSARTPVGPGNVGLRTDFVLERSLPPDQYYWSVQSVDGAYARSEFSSEGIFVVGQFVSSDQRLRSLTASAMSWGDVDDDGDPDLAIMGTNRSGEPQTLLYVNRAGTLALNADAGLTHVGKGDLEWGDGDGDGDLDLIVTGEVSEGNHVTRFYRTQTGAGTPRFASFSPGPDITQGAATWGDVDNDGDLDLLLAGQSRDVVGGTQMSYTRVWVNDGGGAFAATRDDSLVGLNNGEAAWADVDLDGDLDLAVNGKSSVGTREFRLYRNDLPLPLTDTDSGLPGLESSDLAWGDYDRDGDLDLVAAGVSVDGSPSTQLFDNDLGTLSPHTAMSFTGIQGGDLAWGDVDNDQDLDLLVVGNTGDQPVFRVYENTIGRTSPDSAFQALHIGALAGVDFSSVALADIDDDGDLDLISSGRTASWSPLTAVNDNLTSQQYNANYSPVAPALQTPADTADSVVLTWLAGSDDGAPPPQSLTYSLRVGTSPGSGDVLSGATDLGAGNAGHSLSQRLLGLASGTYYWTARTIDAGFAASAWTPTQRFVIDTVPPRLDTFRVNRDDAGIGQAVTLALEFADVHSGVNAGISPTVLAVIGDSTYSFEELQFTGTSWSGELAIAADMPSGTSVVSVADLKDGKGNALVPRDSVTTFVVDTDLPGIVRRDPVPDAAGVSASLSEIAITFSEPLLPATATAPGNYAVRLVSEDEAVAATPSYDAATLVVDLDLEGQLRPGAEYSVEVSAAIEDLVGNRPANAMSWTFRTAIPQLLSTDPAGDAVSVPAGTNGLSATFDSGIWRTALSADGAVRVLREGEAADLRADPSFDDSTGVLSFELAEPLRAGTRYEAVLSGRLAGPLRAVSEGDFRWSFSTAVPRLTARTPDSGAVAAVGELTEAVASFSTPLDADLAVADNFAVLRDGEGVSLRAGDPVVRGDGAYGFAPAADWQVGSSYTVRVSPAVTGPLGSTQTLTWQFQTAVPTVTEVSPADGDTTVSVLEPNLTISFDGAVDESALRDPDAVRVLRGGEQVDLADTPVFDGATHTLSFSVAGGLRSGSRYEVMVSGLLGGSLRAVADGDFAWRFATAVPQLVAVVPDASAVVKAGELVEAVASFSTPLDDDLAVVGNFSLLREGEELPLRAGDPVVRGDGTYGLAPAGGWQVGSSYTVQISPVVTGPRGAALPLTWQFQTSVPTIAEVSPAAEDTTVSTLDPGLAITFDGDIDASALQDPDAVRVFRGGERVDLQGSPVYDGATRTLSFAVAEGLRVGSRYEVTVSGLVAGPLRAISDGDFSWSFATAVPLLVSATPEADAVVKAGDLAEVVASFSVPLDDAKVDAANFNLLREGGPATLRSGDPVVRGDGTYGFAPAEGWQVGSSYAVQISPVVSGPRGALQPLTWQFQTAVPTVAAVAPSDGDSTVSPLEPTLSIAFDSAIDETALRTELGVVLLEEGNAVDVGTPVYDAGTYTVTIAPSVGLRAGSSYGVQISSDVAGPGAAGPFGWHFQTLIPEVVATTPGDGAVISSGPRRIQVDFSSPVDADLRTSRNFRVTSSGVDEPLADEEFLYDEDSFVVSLPETDFESGRAYELTVSSRLGGPRADRPDHRATFRTEIPGVVGTAPEDGDEGVSAAVTAIRVEFSYPVARPEQQLFEVRARALAEVLLQGDEAPFELAPLTGFGVDPSGTAINFSLAHGLQPFTEYQISVGREVLGELAPAGFTWSFQTAAHLADAAAGGTISSPNGSVELYFPPNGLHGGTGEIIITPAEDVPAGKPVAAPSQDGRTLVGQAYRIEAVGAQLRKPATLTLSYADADLGDRDPAALGVFSYSGADWERVGGTPDVAQRSVTSTVDELGVFALFEDLETPRGSAAIRDLDCQPRAFDPTGGSLRSRTDISFQLTNPADVTIRVYNTSGRLERVLARDLPMAPGRNTSPAPWDGLDQDGDIVASGLYVVVVTAGDSQDEQIVAVVR